MLTNNLKPIFKLSDYKQPKSLIMKLLHIDELLLLTKSKRKELLKSFDFGNRKKIFDSIITMSELYQLDKIDSHEERVIMRDRIIKENPNVVFWDYGIHLNYNGDIVNVTCASKISTNGDVVTLNSKGVFSISSNIDRKYNVKYKTLSNVIFMLMDYLKRNKLM